MKEMLQYGVPVACAIIAAWSVRREQKNRRLRQKLKWVLSECHRFYDLEESYCGALAELTWHRTPLAAKRFVRSMQRSRGIETPTVTPQEIAREMERL